MLLRTLPWLIAIAFFPLVAIGGNDTLNSQSDSLGLMPSKVIASGNPAELFDSANELYIQGAFDDAVQAYQMLVDSGYYSFELFYNLGNAYYKTNRIPSAILNYERAHMLKPNDEDVQFNLELARKHTVDRIDELPEFLLTVWYRDFRGILSSDAWAVISLVLMGGTLLLILVFWFGHSSTIKRLSFAGAILTLLLMALTMVFSVQERNRLESRDRAVVFTPVVAVKSSPSDSGHDIFILHAGTSVRVTNRLADWVEIQIADGNKGWIPVDAVEMVQVW